MNKFVFKYFDMHWKSIIQKLNDAPLLQFSLIVFLLSPLFFINVIAYHDWGGDFAQYIQQAINIAEGKAQGETHYIFNPDNKYIGPPSYPVGFPLLLAPVYFLFGNSIFAFSYFMTIIIVLSMYLVFRLLKRFYTTEIALSTSMIFAYNPWVLRFKGEILSDFPFLLFFLLALLSYLKGKETAKRKSFAIKTGLFTGFSMLIKNIGFILLPAIFFDLLIEYLQNYKTDKKTSFFKNFEPFTIIFSTSVAFYLFVNYLLFPAKQELYTFFSSLYDFNQLGNILLTTSDYYIQVLQNFFQTDNGSWSFVPQISKSFALTFFFLGFLLKILKKIEVTEFLLLFYLFAILSFPNTTQGFRYLLPVFPLILYYIIYGLSSVKMETKLPPKLLPFIFLLIILLQYRREIRQVAHTQSIMNGPQSPEAKEVFHYIIQNTKPDAQIVFVKPRVLALYTQRYSYSNNPKTNYPPIKQQLEKFGYDYILLMTDIKNPPLQKYLDIYTNEHLKVFENKKFKLYKKIILKN